MGKPSSSSAGRASRNPVAGIEEQQPGQPQELPCPPLSRCTASAGIGKSALFPGRKASLRSLVLWDAAGSARLSLSSHWSSVHPACPGGGGVPWHLGAEIHSLMITRWGLGSKSFARSDPLFPGKR